MGLRPPLGVTLKIPSRPGMFLLCLLTSCSVLDVTSNVIFVRVTFTVQFFMPSE